ncbi:pectinesterase [Xylariaceae sp. FL0255]|nr:pectinesterase [Xylariaceae sp. FL0255]
MSGLSYGKSICYRMKVIISMISSASIALAVSRTTAPAGCVHVAASGGDYTTVQAAVDGLSTTSTAVQCIFIDQGTYTEQVYIPARTAELTIYGYTIDSTSYHNNKATLTYNLSQANVSSDDLTATLRMWSANAKVYNLNMVNSYGDGSQAVALSAQASSGYYGCQIYGFQDTLLANKGLQYYSGCEITGAVDFIFGKDAQAWFENCDIRVRSEGEFITANGRDSSTDASYYLLNRCNVAAGAGETVARGTYYLGRPWEDYSRVVYQNTALSAVINSAGWSEWDGSTDLANVYYAEYNSTGPGADPAARVSWSHQLVAPIGMTTVLGSGYASAGWYDATYPS